MKTIVAEIMNEAEERIKKEIMKLNQDIEEFSNSKIPKIEYGDKLLKSLEIRDKWFKEHMEGRMSTGQLTKNYERKLKLENEMHQIINFKYQHKEWFP